ncbi:MAG: hypothetical protein ACYS6W_14430 [Planctomycetota bacterium]|jgi:hypothetical protein
MRQIIWTCDWCGKKESTDDEYSPNGWYEKSTKPVKRHYHSEECLLMSMTAKQREEYRDKPWMA